MIQDVPFDEIQVGQAAQFSKTISEADVYIFAGLCGDFNPLHVNTEFARDSVFKERIVHGMLSASLISTVLGTALPGVNTIYLEQALFSHGLQPSPSTNLPAFFVILFLSLLISKIISATLVHHQSQLLSTPLPIILLQYKIFCQIAFSLL